MASGLTPSNADLSQLARAIQKGGLIYALDQGTANAYSATLSPVPLAYYTGMFVNILVGNSSTGASTINLNALGARPIIRKDGTPLLLNDMRAGRIATLVMDDGGAFELIGSGSGRPALGANLTIFVNGAIGNDSNDGVSNTSGHALATPQAAVNLAFSYAPSQFGITIQIAAGNYGPAITPGYSGPTITINGATTASVLLDGGGAGPAVAVQGPNTVSVANLTGQNSAPSGQSPIFLSSNGATMTNSNTASNGTNNAVFQAFGASFNPGNHTFKSNCGSFFLANQGGHMQFIPGAAFGIASPLTVSTAVANASDCGTIGVPNVSVPTFVNPGNVTGPRYLATTNGVINTSGAGATYFPGTVSGSVSTGGQYA